MSVSFGWGTHERTVAGPRGFRLRCGCEGSLYGCLLLRALAPTANGFPSACIGPGATGGSGGVLTVWTA